MQYRKAQARYILIFLILFLSLLPVAAFAAAGGNGVGHSESVPRSAEATGRLGHGFPARSSAELVGLPAPSPAADPYADLAWQFPSPGSPGPTFAPENTKHVYVVAKDSAVAPPSGVASYRCDGVDDQVEIGAAIAAARGGVVELLDGGFRCSDSVALPNRTTLRGQGSLKTTVEIRARPGQDGYLPISVGGEYVNVGGFTLRGNAFVMVRRSHVRVQDVRATCVDLDGVWHAASGNGMFFVWVAPPVDAIDDVEFYECHVVNAHTHGFNMNQDYGDGVSRAVTNIRFLNCRAVRCGYGVAGDPGITAPVTSANQSRSEWITGFDLQEWQDLADCTVENCIAADNWESGFHLEPGGRYDDAGNEIGPETVARNVVFRNCVSTGNGQRNTCAGHFFMSGYYLSRDTHLYDCSASANRNAGYLVEHGSSSSFSGCTDNGSTCGWKVCKASAGIGLTDCSSSNNLRWALWIAFAERIAVTAFRQAGPAGDRGYQSILGWYNDDPNYELPVTDSRFEISASGDRSLGIINPEGGGNTYLLRWDGVPVTVPTTVATTRPTTSPTPTPTSSGHVRTMPGSIARPHDLDGDGRYEDVNGNRRGDFTDVVLYFNQMAWVAANQPLSPFDYNRNGRIDFADVVWLFNHL